MITFCTSEDGTCYIETIELDGENNLKIKSALKETQNLFSDKDNHSNLIEEIVDGFLITETPNKKLYTFEGSLRFKNWPRAFTIDNNNVLLRGSTLKNTQ